MARPWHYEPLGRMQSPGLPPGAVVFPPTTNHQVSTAVPLFLILRPLFDGLGVFLGEARGQVQHVLFEHAVFTLHVGDRVVEFGAVLVLGVLGLFHRLVPDVVGLVGLVGFHLGKHDLVVLLEHALDVGVKGLALFAHFALLGFLDLFALFILG